MSTDIKMQEAVNNVRNTLLPRLNEAEARLKELMPQVRAAEEEIKLLRSNLDVLAKLEQEAGSGEASEEPTPSEAESNGHDAGSLFDFACRTMMSMRKPFCRPEILSILQHKFPRPFAPKTLDRPFAHLLRIGRIEKIRENVGNQIPALYRVKGHDEEEAEHETVRHSNRT